MNEKTKMKNKIWELDFALHELVLFLDTHPNSMKALALMRAYRKLRQEAVEAYEQKFGKLDTTARKVDPNTRWTWIDGPWPWENKFAEE